MLWNLWTCALLIFLSYRWYSADMEAGQQRQYAHATSVASKTVAEQNTTLTLHNGELQRRAELAERELDVLVNEVLRRRGAAVVTPTKYRFVDGQELVGEVEYHWTADHGWRR